MNRKTIRKNNIYIGTQSEKSFDIIQTDERPILVRQLEQDLQSQEKNYLPQLRHGSEEDMEKNTKMRTLARAVSNQAVIESPRFSLNEYEMWNKNDAKIPDALRVALWNTTKHGVYLPESILRDRKQLYKFCSDFCYLWTMDELREYCSVAGLLACGTKTELLRRTYLALHRAEKEFLES